MTTRQARTVWPAEGQSSKLCRKVSRFWTGTPSCWSDPKVRMRRQENLSLCARQGASVLPPKYLGIRKPLHPDLLRQKDSAYVQYASPFFLAARAHRLSRCASYFGGSTLADHEVEDFSLDKDHFADGFVRQLVGHGRELLGGGLDHGL